MASIASDDGHSSATSDDHDTSSVEDSEPVGDTVTSERRHSIPAIIGADENEEEDGGKYGLHNKDGPLFEDEFDVITVHGLHGDRETSWQARDESKRETVKGLADLALDLGFRLMNYGYDTLKGQHSILSKEGIAEEASNLLRELTEARKWRDKDTFRGIVFVSHDIGGTIVKRALCQAVTDPQYADIAYSTKWLIFLGCPHRWHSVSDMEDKIARLVFSGPNVPQSNVLSHVQSLARAVIECNEAFVESKALLRAEILSIRSSLTDLNECIFDEFEASFRTGFTYGYDFSQPHAFLPCAEEMSSIRSFFVDFKNQLKPSSLPAEQTEEFSYLDMLVSLASPVRSILLHRYHSHPLTSSSQFTDWLENTRSDILVVHGRRTTQRISGYAYEKIVLKSSLDDISTYFSFDQNDDRYNSTQAFLKTTLAQWVTKEQVIKADFNFRREMSRFCMQRSFTEQDLLILLARLRSIYLDGETVFVLDNLDECADRLSSFWRLVAEIFETRDKPWKFLIFTKSEDSLDEWLKSWPSITLENESTPEESCPCVTDEIDGKLHQFDTGSAVGPTIRNSREQLLRKCGDDIGLTRLLFEDLQNCQSQRTHSSLIAALKALPDTTVDILIERALNAIPEAKRRLVARAITWVLFSFHPLSLGELHSALAISEQTHTSSSAETHSDRSSSAPDIANALADVAIFDFSNIQEIRFQHPKLRDFILQSENEWYDVKRSAHEVMAETCLTFLSTPTAQESLSTVCTVQHGVLSTPSVKPRTDIASYAASYWSRHYTLASTKSHLRQQALEFFQNKAAMRAWEMAYWFMSNPFSRTDRSYLSELPLLASTGLQDVYERWVKEANITQADEQAWLPYALAEAARNGHRKSVHRMLQSAEFNSATAEYVLMAASSYGDEDVLIDLVSHIRKALPSFTWPPFLVRRASWVGHARLVQTLADAGADLSGRDGAMFSQGSLHLAARNSHLEVVKVLLKHDPSLIRAVDEDNTSPLYFATIRGNPDLIRVLIEHGAQVNESEDIPITRACSSSCPAAVRVLLENGAQTDTTRDEGGPWPPLPQAAAEGNYRCVEALLEFNADVNHGCPGGTALRLAVTSNRLEICSLLLKHGADPNYQLDDVTVLKAAIRENNFEMVKLLVEHGADVNRRPDEDTSTALHEATIQNLSLEIVEYLVGNGADVNLRTPLGSPLFESCVSNNVEMTRLLIEKGADVNATFSGCWTPLHGAFKNAAVTRLLLEAGASVDKVVEDNGRSPLFLAAEWGQTDVLEALIEYKADVNLQFLPKDEEYMSGFTPLAVALRGNFASVARLLLEAGADISIKPVNGLAPLYYADDTELLRMVMEFRPDLELEDNDGDTVLNAILHRDSPRLSDVKVLVHGGSNINATNQAGRAPLHKALSWDHLDIAKFLIKKGADIHISALSGGTPLHFACSNGSLDGVRLMLEAGADVNMVNAFLGSPAQAACRRSSPKSGSFEEDEALVLEILRHLLESSAGKLDVNVVGGLYGSALGGACYLASLPVIRLLLDHGARTDTRDQSGRYPIHFAAAQCTANFEALRDANADLYVRDKAGRTIVHFAVVGGKLDLLQCVLQATDGLLDVADDDGWTPLHYAARGTYHRYHESDLDDDGWNEKRHEIVSFLVDQGSDIWALSIGPDKQWSPLKLANYHGAQDKTLDLLTPKIKTSAEGKQWDDEYHKSKKAFQQTPYCDACLFKVWGVRYRCKDCWDFDFCSKCYASREILHPDHEWEPIGQEFEDDPISEPEAADEDSESDDTDCESDDSTSNDGSESST